MQWKVKNTNLKHSESISDLYPKFKQSTLSAMKDQLHTKTCVKQLNNGIVIRDLDARRNEIGQYHVAKNHLNIGVLIEEEKNEKFVNSKPMLPAPIMSGWQMLENMNYSSQHLTIQAKYQENFDSEQQLMDFDDISIGTQPQD